jgi:hypothetical protein
MLPDIDFRKIRVWNASQREGFEELCCQLYSMECPTDGSIFWRKDGAGGDAGVECFWKLPDGTEHGLQAKFLFDIGDSQWSQIDDSVKTAIEKHPKLTHYIICLPMNLTDRRQTGQKSNKDKWDEHQTKWEGWCSDAGISIEFLRWDETALCEKLTIAKPEYSGKVLYWFNTNAFRKFL